MSGMWYRVALLACFLLLVTASGVSAFLAIRPDGLHAVPAFLAILSALFAIVAKP